LVNSKGEQGELAPLFSASTKDLEQQAGTWVIHKEDSLKRDRPGSDFWVTVQSKSSNFATGSGSTIHAQTTCSNLTACERLNAGQRLAIIGSAPVLSVSLVGNPSNYVKPNSSSSHLWTLLSYLSLSHQSLSDPETAKAVIVSILSMHARNDDLSALHQIESIESITATPDQAVVKNAGWKGYYTGVKYTVSITDKKFDGSIMLFGGVLSNMLALFCNVNSFSCLEISIGNKVFHKWPPKTGRKIVA
jgi:type VI secretion system protein ImpG